MTEPISLPLPEGYDEQSAQTYACEVAQRISRNFGCLNSTISFMRDSRNRITSALLFFEEYSTGNPLNPSPKLLRTPLEEIFPPSSFKNHGEQHLRGKSLSRLASIGITQVGQLVLYYDQSYLLSADVPQFGREMLNYVQKHLADFGLSIPEKLE